MRRMWQEILTNLTIPLIVGLLLAIASGKREDRRQHELTTTPSYEALQVQLAAEQAQLSDEKEARDLLRVDLSKLRDERDALHTQLGDWQDWGHDLVRNWATVRTHPEPPNCPDRSNT